MIKIDYSKQGEKRITVETKASILYFDVERIKYIICDGRYCNVYFINKSERRVRRPLKFFAQNLEKVGFFHANRNTLVNIRYIEDAQFSNTKRTLHIEATKTEPIIVSRRKVSVFKKISKL